MLLPSAFTKPDGSRLALSQRRRNRIGARSAVSDHFEIIYGEIESGGEMGNLHGGFHTRSIRIIIEVAGCLHICNAIKSVLRMEAANMKLGGGQRPGRAKAHP